MRQKISILYAWFIKVMTCLWPDTPFFMRIRGAMYSLMMKDCGTNFQVTATTVLNPLSGMQVGNDVYIAHHTVLIGTDIQIEDEVLIGPNCVISSSNHSFNQNSYRFGSRINGKVFIKKGSWVAGNCSLLMGAVLPERSVLAAGSVLTKEMKDMDTIYGGVPAKIIKKRGLA